MFQKKIQENKIDKIIIQLHSEILLIVEEIKKNVLIISEKRKVLDYLPKNTSFYSNTIREIDREKNSLANNMEKYSQKVKEYNTIDFNSANTRKEWKNIFPDAVHLLSRYL